MKVIYIKSREIFGLVREGSPSSDYIHYRSLTFGLGRRICSENDIVDITSFIKNPNFWQNHEIEMINMIMPEFSKETLTFAAKYAKLAG